jgi:Epoxide hydrolase N terminus
MDDMSEPNRRTILAAAAAGAVGISAAASARAAAPQTGDTAIRPFRVEVPEEALVDLRRRINATKWPDREQVSDDSQGVQLDTIEKLARYWATKAATG